MASVLVSGDGARTFYYLPGHTFNLLVGSEQQKLSKVQGSPGFGPHYGAQSVDVIADVNYLFFPLCNNRLAMHDVGTARVNSGTASVRVVLKCP
ncbi:MAG: hypothetical protein JSS36_10735 [Proteobacteria bacterium]|nr:hypothetical protein [Pseudomonadota bacterium]